MNDNRLTSLRDTIGGRVGLLALELAMLGAVWWFLKLHEHLVIALAAVIVASGLAPARYSTLVSAVGLGGVAALVYFRFGNTQVAGLLAVFSAVLLVVGIAKILPRSARSGDR